MNLELSRLLVRSEKRTVHSTWVKHHRKRNAAILGSAVLIVVVIAIVVIGFVGAGVKIGQRVPDFTLQDVMTGSSFHLYDFSGKTPVLLEFMRTTCSHCQNEAPVLSQLYSTYVGKVAFVSITIDPANDQPSVLKGFAQTHNSMWTWLIDKDQSTTNAYGISGTPTIFLLDKNMVLQQQFVGEAGSSTLESGIQSILS
jgi:cytochrome c biogenesis protein CcmG, thiol:disulfide interchange protein DsbE